MHRHWLKWVALIVPPLAIFTPQFVATTGLSVGDIARQYFSDVMIMPAGYAFSIWSVIYLGILALAVVQALPGRDDDLHFVRARWPLILTMVCNWLWLVTWQSLLIPLATLVIVGQYATAIWLYYALGIPGEDAWSGVERWLRAGVSLYVGWLTVATIVNVAAFLNYLGWTAGATAWTVVLLIAGAGLGLFLRFTWLDAVFGAVFVWAYAAIGLRAGQPAVVVVVAFALAAVVLLSLFPTVVEYGARLHRRLTGGGGRRGMAGAG